MDNFHEHLVEGLSPDQPTVTNEKGGKQSDTPYGFNELPPLALFAEAKVLAAGAKKYGSRNWTKIPIEDHLNHALQHIFAYLAGDRSDHHLANLSCRSHFALELAELAKQNTPLTTLGYEMTKPSEILERLHSLAERNNVCIDCFISLREVNGYYGAGTGSGQRFRCENCHKRREAFKELDEAAQYIKEASEKL